MSQGKEFLDELDEDTGEPNRERIRGFMLQIDYELEAIKAALHNGDTEAVSNHFKEIRGWAQAGLDQVAVADDVWGK